MLCCSWDIARNWCSCSFFFHFELFFALLPPKQPEKSKLKKKEKKHLEISSFYNSVPKIMIKCYTVPEICHVTDVIIFHLGHFFPFTPLSVWKIKIKKKKKRLEISSFYICVPKIIIRWCTVLEIWCGTDGQTDGKGTYRWVSHLKIH